MSVLLPDDIAGCVQRALAEDIGGGDLTAALIDANARAAAQVIAREEAVLCGSAWFEEVFRQLDAGIRVSWHAQDGDAIHASQVLCRLEGRARGLLSGERTALNFLQTLSGTATTARRYAEAVKNTRAVILDTRKTLPGLRGAQKYAVRVGGAHNHRLGLFDGILIKENHIAAAGGIAAAIAAARHQDAKVPVEIEVETLEQLRAAIAAGADIVLLDNFDLDGLRAAVRETAGRARLEASGGVDLERVRAIAATGVDYISVGALTKHLHAVDLSMRFDFAPRGN
ncbi:MAG TPA: carboxylating nicotinate-nucleotide diphosphorylase [Gammaproteobacteria bacterium]|nr:carboxylating nicotinate-nucleotide diphosphorylase [Gammaproteobacteria bacterium]